MLRILKLFLLFMLATVGHWAFVALLGQWGISVNLMLIFVIAVCTIVPPAWGYPVAFVGGLFLDFFSTTLFGAHAFTFILCSWGIYGVARRLDFDSFFPQMAVVFVWTLGAAFLNSLLIWIFANRILWAGLGSIVTSAFIGACCAPILFRLIYKILSSAANGPQ